MNNYETTTKSLLLVSLRISNLSIFHINLVRLNLEHCKAYQNFTYNHSTMTGSNFTYLFTKCCSDPSRILTSAFHFLLSSALLLKFLTPIQLKCLTITSPLPGQVFSFCWFLHQFSRLHTLSSHFCFHSFFPLFPNPS